MLWKKLMCYCCFYRIVGGLYIRENTAPTGLLHVKYNSEWLEEPDRWYWLVVAGTTGVLLAARRRKKP